MPYEPTEIQIKGGRSPTIVLRLGSDFRGGIDKILYLNKTVVRMARL